LNEAKGTIKRIQEIGN